MEKVHQTFFDKIKTINYILKKKNQIFAIQTRD